MRLRRDTDEDIGFNMTPMIDVVFLLNIFFLLSTKLIDSEKEMDLQLPQAQSGRPEEQAPKEIIINVLADGRMRLGDTFYEMNPLVEKLKQVSLLDQTTPVTIRGDKGTDFQNAVHAMDACMQANLSRISVGILDGAVGESRVNR